MSQALKIGALAAALIVGVAIAVLGETKLVRRWATKVDSAHDRRFRRSQIGLSPGDDPGDEQTEISAPTVVIDGGRGRVI